MELIWPRFDDAYLHGIAVCGYTDQPHPDAGLRRLSGETRRSTYQIDGGAANVTLFTSVKSDEDRWHIHLEVERNSPEQSGERDKVQLREIESILEHFRSFAFRQYLDAKFAVPRVDLPDLGMIEALLGVSTGSCGSDLLLRGARFAIHGDDGFTDVSWTLDESTDLVMATIYAERDDELDAEYIDRAVKFMQAGVRCFILEEGASPHVHRPQGENPSARQAHA